MSSGHAQDYLYDTVAFAILLIPFCFIAALIVASVQERRLRTRGTVRERKERSR
jgi:hypothetical protein